VVYEKYGHFFMVYEIFSDFFMGKGTKPILQVTVQLNLDIPDTKNLYGQDRKKSVI
jgi:hypothetical protein